MKVFNHNYKAPISEKELHEIKGYQKAMTSLFEFLAQRTGFKNRMVDAVEILDGITEANAEFANLLKMEQKIMEQTNLGNQQ